jgi:protein-L-isoaspartate(D-aspartate) O-methyltransferase
MSGNPSEEFSGTSYDSPWYAAERDRMVETQIISRGVDDQLVLEAMRSVPRHVFVPPEHRELSYADGALPIASGQTISQPYIVALMTEMLQLKGIEKVLEVGTGSGYQAAILSYIACEVHTIERHPSLARHAARILEHLNIANVQVHVGDGTLGYPEAAPFAAIIVTAAAPDVPQALLEQLEEGGRLVIPVGHRGDQYLQRWRRHGHEYKHENILPVAFVPLIGAQGWKE